MTELSSTLEVIWAALLHLATVVGVLLALLLVAQVLRSPRTPAATIGWLLAILVVPVAGIPLYLAFGERKVRAQIRRKARIELPDTPDTHDHPLHSLLVSLGIPSSSPGNRVAFHADEEQARQALFAMLDGARQSIDIAIFILGDDRVGREILTRLEHKAGQGVRVRLLLDGVGSFQLPRHALQPLRAQGGRVAWFMPVVHRPLRGRTNLRNHRKLVIVDGGQVWTGGRNLATEYLGPGCDGGCWIDLSFCLQGPGVAVCRAVFEADWRFATGDRSDVGLVPVPAADGASRVQVIPSGPDVRDDPIYAALLTAAFEARQRILIVTPYYVPDPGVQEALRLAALRGVRVELILPLRSNHRLADIARNRYLRELAAAGAVLWFLPEVMIHAKAVVVDNGFAMAGTANMDIRSLFLNYEVVCAFYSPADIVWLTSWLESLRDRCRRHRPPPAGVLGDILEGLVLLGAYQL